VLGFDAVVALAEFAQEVGGRFHDPPASWLMGGLAQVEISVRRDHQADGTRKLWKKGFVATGLQRRLFDAPARPARACSTRVANEGSVPHGRDNDY
jgi:hypothetical protein